MSAIIPDWPEVSEDMLMSVLHSINWRIVRLGDADKYVDIGRNQTIAYRTLSKKYYIHPQFLV